ncbi:MAG: DUF2723 domain-containing protein [Bacteroidales bacterium]|nr:DUF2723 domain-containing protein [Candidatus Cryptobacteroides faecihippi]
MDNKKFRLWNLMVGAVVFLVATVTYLSTIEPTASFWDCGEFIASSYKLEVGHPPGNPVFQLIARFFTMFTGPDKAAVMVNSMSALCSSLTIFFLYLTIVFFVKRLVAGRKEDEGREDGYSLGSAIAIMGSGAVGALAYCFSDTFWFSAVEGEVYAMSSLFTAIVVWAMTKWYEAPDRRYSNRWIILISFLMGLSIGVHLLNLLAIPMLVFMYYFKMREDKPYTFMELLKMILVSVVILGVIVFLMVPLFPKLAAYVDLFIVNTLGLPCNTGAAFFLVALLTPCFSGLFKTLDKGKVFLNTALPCFTTIVIGFSLFTVVIIRSSAKTPTNEYQPDNAFTLVRYLSREQYGKVPLLYGQYFGSTYTLVASPYWAPVDGRYKKVDGPSDVKYDASSKMLFPRMYSNDDRHIKFYQYYMNGKGIPVPGSDQPRPTFGANLRYFFDFQVGWMYWRYFMWNFVGRQNELHASSQDPFAGNWESGIKPVDEIRLSNQDNAPDWLKNNKGKNHYFFLPLLLGLLGLVFQFDKDKRGCWLTFLLFFMTGIAIVIYLNQTPYQVRERDYAYAGSFYAFCIWIGLGVAALHSWLTDAFKAKKSTAVAATVTAACLFVPALMAEENWDDHDRSNRYTAVEIARNYLNSVGENGLLVTHGDNDTFPLWYVQEVEGFRNDVRVCNTSLLGTDWYIDQMKYACNNSPALKLSVGQNQYLYGINDWVPVSDSRNQAIMISDCIKVFKHPDAKVVLHDGKKIDYWVSRKMILPVNKENCLKHGIVSEKFASEIPDSIVLEIPASKNYLSKPEIFLLDFLSTYEWDRPINLLNQGGDLNIGIKDYLMYDGFSYRFTPVKNKIQSLEVGKVDTDELYDIIMNRSCYDAISRKDYFVDYQNLYTFLGVMSLRNMFVSSANAFFQAGEYGRVEEALDKCQEVLDPSIFPYENSLYGWSSNALFPIEMTRDYYAIGKPEKARALASELYSETKQSILFYLDFYPDSKSDFEYCCNIVYYMISTISKSGDKEFADKIEKDFAQYLSVSTGAETGENPSSGE